MKLFNANQIRRADNFTIKQEPIESIDLMERAALSIFKVLRKFITKNQKIYIICGKGNNGGDGYALARILYLANYSVAILKADFLEAKSADCKLNALRCKTIGVKEIYIEEFVLPFQLKENDVLIDALLGTGIAKPVSGNLEKLINELNGQQGIKIAIDVPSGLYVDEYDEQLSTVFKADYTYTFQFLKRSFCLPETVPYTGKVQVLDIGLHSLFIDSEDSDWELTSTTYLKSFYKVRSRHSYKGNYGHTLLVSGSFGMMGAAILGSKSCLKTGTGLLTTHIPQCGYEVLQVTVPEAMCSVDAFQQEVTEVPLKTCYTSLAIGPGLGRSSSTIRSIYKLLKGSSQPVVLDADGLQVLLEKSEVYSELNGRAILTPHTGEFDQLFGKHENRHQRILTGLEQAKKHNIVIVLKGANTAILLPNQKVYINPTGNSGMAKAGSGDVLTGMIAGLIAQGYQLDEAAILGVWLHGQAADCALRVETEETLTAQNIIEHIPYAYKMLTVRKTND